MILETLSRGFSRYLLLRLCVIGGGIYRALTSLKALLVGEEMSDWLESFLFLSLLSVSFSDGSQLFLFTGEIKNESNLFYFSFNFSEISRASGERSKELGRICFQRPKYQSSAIQQHRPVQGA